MAARKASAEAQAADGPGIVINLTDFQVRRAAPPTPTRPTTFPSERPSLADLAQETRERVMRRDQRAEAVQRLIDAASRLASTIATTEELAQRRAEILRTRNTIVAPRLTGPGREELISLANAARRTGRHPEVLRRWCSEGRIPAVRVGRSWAISPRTLNNLLQHASRSRPRFATDERT